MSDLLLYLIKVNIALSLFYLIYYVWLRNLTFYRINRYFLLFSLSFSLLYPLLNWNLFNSSSNLPPQIVNIVPKWEYQYSQNTQVSFSESFANLFYLTLLVFGFRLFISLFGILRIHLSSKASIWNNYNYRKSDEDILPFSFWKNIYLNPSKHKENELEGIFRHEYVHIRQLHSIDILLIEIVLIICWYNPFAWFLRRGIKENIEFITDSNVLASGINKQLYQYNLLTVLTNSKQHPTIANYFNVKGLKKRISMMNRKQTSNFHVAKYVLLVPAIIACLSFVTISEAKQRTVIPNEIVNTLLEIRTSTLKLSDTTRKDTVKSKSHPKGSIEKIDTVKREKDSQTKVHPHHSDKKPLMIVDGKIIDNSDLKSIKPEDIESISILKDKSAIAEYGKEGGNGVILITLKEKSNTNTLIDTVTTADPSVTVKRDIVQPAEQNKR